MKRKTTPLPKPRGQVTLGLFSPPPHPQAGHRAIDALLHHPHVLKRSHSSRQCLSGWHPETGKILTLPQYFVPSLIQRSHQNWTCIFPAFITHWNGFIMCWCQDYFSTLVSKRHSYFGKLVWDSRLFCGSIAEVQMGGVLPPMLVWVEW